MRGVYKGAPAKGCPAPGSWGDRYVIEKEEYHSTRMSCNKCIHYCADDKSCSVEPVYFPVDGWDRWKYCKKLELSPEYDNFDTREKVKRVKGEDYFNQKKKDAIKNESAVQSIPSKNKPVKTKSTAVTPVVEKNITVDEIPIGNGMVWGDFVKHVLLSLNNKYKVDLLKRRVFFEDQEVFNVYTDIN